MDYLKGFAKGLGVVLLVLVSSFVFVSLLSTMAHLTFEETSARLTLADWVVSMMLSTRVIWKNKLGNWLLFPAYLFSYFSLPFLYGLAEQKKTQKIIRKLE